MALKEWQIAHNKALDSQVEMAEYEHRRRQEENELKIKKWNEYRDVELKKNPNKLIPISAPGLDMTPRKIVIGIRYVE